MTMRPFSDDSAVVSVADLSIENGTDTVTISGSLEIAKDRVGLRRAHALKEVVDAVVGELEASDNLPDELEVTTKPTKQVPNPFT